MRENNINVSERAFNVAWGCASHAYQQPVPSPDKHRGLGVRKGIRPVKKHATSEKCRNFKTDNQIMLGCRPCYAAHSGTTFAPTLCLDERGEVSR